MEIFFGDFSISAFLLFLSHCYMTFWEIYGLPVTTTNLLQVKIMWLHIQHLKASVISHWCQKVEKQLRNTLRKRVTVKMVQSHYYKQVSEKTAPWFKENMPFLIFELTFKYSKYTSWHIPTTIVKTCLSVIFCRNLSNSWFWNNYNEETSHKRHC